MPISPHPDPDGRFDRGHLLFVVGVSVGILAFALKDRLLPSPSARDARLFIGVRDLAAETFVEEVDSKELLDDALRGMIDDLDRYSHYYDAEEISTLKRETEGEFRGIGVVFRRPTHEGQVLFPFPGSPAERAGLRVGDVLSEIEGALVSEMEPGGLQSRLQNPRRAEIEFLVRGLNGEVRRIVVRPEKIIDPTVRHVRLLDREPGIGYLAIVSFSHRTLEEFDEAMALLSGHDLEALVLDLRGNPGGILDAAVGIANRFLAEGDLVSTRNRGGIQTIRARPEQAYHENLDLVLLVDEGSASASEVLAGALQDHARAILVGEKTFGKGTVQTLTPFDGDRAVVKLTTACYFTPAWRRIERNDSEDHGITPDVLVELDPEHRAKVHEFLGSYSPPREVEPDIRAWEQAAGIDLIPEPPPDLQIETALGLIRGIRPGEDLAHQ